MSTEQAGKPRCRNGRRFWMPGRTVFGPTGPGDPASARPILVAIAASGGGLRAGVWTAAVLDAIGNEVPEFPKHVRYVTGASGGMVGAALFVTSRVRAPTAGGLPGTPPPWAVLPTDSRMII